MAAGTNVNDCIQINGTLQELSIRQGKPTPFYLDSITTIFVARKDAARKSMWLQRRIHVLQEAVEANEILPLHISESNMVADPFTKYLTFKVWARLTHYLLNKPGDAQDL